MAFSVLDDPTVRERALRFTIEQYQAMGAAGLIPKRTELLEGIIVNKSSQSPQQVYYRSAIAELLRIYGEQGWLIRQRKPISFQNSEPEPDVSVVRGEIEDFYHAHPATADLVIEVADGSLELARTKGRIYASAGIPEYWIIVWEERRAEVHRQPSGHDYTSRREYAFPETINSVALPALTLDLAEFFLR